MESVGAFADGEWASFSRMFSADHGFEYPFSHEHDDNFMISSTLCSSLEATMTEAGVTESSFCSLDALNSSLQYIFQENGMGSGCSSTSVSMPSSNHECYYFSDCNNSPMINNNCMPMDYCMAGEKNCSFPPAFPDILVEESVRVNESDGQLEAIAVPAKEWQLKRKIGTPGLNAEEGDKTNSVLSGNPKKKPRTSRDVQKSPKNVSKRIQKLTSCAKDEEESNAGQSSSSCSSEDDIASQELNGVEPEIPSAPTTLSGKTRASRGSATDPQSLYARKRRERINERLRILQNLVPNGTKVDISTMLEEAVEYVKFLKLQIKLLSSDEMWMYAPIAYNGMDIGLNRNMSL